MPSPEPFPIPDEAVEAVMRWRRDPEDQDLVEYKKANYPKLYEEEAEPIREEIRAALPFLGIAEVLEEYLGYVSIDGSPKRQALRTKLRALAAGMRKAS